MDSDGSFCVSDEENVTLANKPKASGAKKGAGGKKGGKQAKKKAIVVDSDDDDFSEEDDMFDEDVDMAPSTKKGAGKKNNRRTSMERAQLSNKYQKKTQLEHIMLRPDTYIGSTEKVTTDMWVFDEGHGMRNRKVTYVPGLYKIFDEILVNASDNKQRDPNMKAIKVTIDQESGAISVWNDGKGIPVEVHAEHKVYIPELVFGHLMTGENFQDTQKRVVGGRNGYGAKLANIFSKHFSVETNDSKSGFRYTQVWKNNMGDKEEPTLKSATSKDFTCVTFTPDYARFGMDGIDADTMALLVKRVHDVAGVTDRSVKVHLNGKLLKVNTFQQYIDLYLCPAPASEPGNDKMSDDDDDDDDDEFEVDPDSDSDFDDGASKRASKKKGKSAKSASKATTTGKTGVVKIYERVNERWEICIAPSPDGQLQQVSFVNGICTMKGGQHVNYVADQVASKLQGFLKKKQKGSEFKPHQIKSHLWIFVNALIVNPAFDSQTKETLTTRHQKFGPKELLPQLSDKSMKAIEKTPIVDNVLYWAKAKEMRELSRKAGGTKKSKIKGVDKLDDANNAGGRNSQKCTLILTEGDSAKTLAISGLSVVGRDNYGVFPLRGKLLNVRDAAHNQIMKNEEIQNIMKIMGLQPGKKYTDTKGLRYGHLMIMTDQDHDGSHIKGLLMNFLHHFWPSLLQVPGFLQVFITPIVKATRGVRSLSFYTMPEYEAWVAGLSAADKKKWKIKYYKGLGTSTAKEAKEYFAEIETHRIDMDWEGDDAGDALEMAFSKKRVADRKTWLGNFNPGTHLNFDVDSIQYKQFVNEELILFSMADNMRSIPSMVDGLKPSQRKVLFSCFKRKLHSDIKVAQLVGYVSEHSAYHHGEASLSSTVVGMAQTFTGSNNINVLYPSGQFGSRILGGKDAASPRYIFTRLATLARSVFHQHDDALLNYLQDDGQIIEPDHYAPVIPFVLVNGAAGIGTGWSTDIPCFNPLDLIAYLRRKIISCEPEGRLQPWYRGFDGSIDLEMHKTKGFTGRYKVRGIFERDEDEEAVIITELPVGTWTQSYKQFLMDEKVFPDGFIKDIRENHTDTKVSFTIFLSPQAFKAMQRDADLVKKFRLETSISTTNMHAYNLAGQIQKYDAPEEIMDEFFEYRLQLYVKRKAHIERILEKEWSKFDNRARFVKMVIEGELVITKRKKKELLEQLSSLGFALYLPEKKNGVQEMVPDGQEEQGDDDDDEDEGNVDDAQLSKGFDYLLSMPLWSLTYEKVQKLNAQRDEKREELDILKAKKPHDLWEEDLDALEKALEDQADIDSKDAADEARQSSKSNKPRRQRKNNTNAKKKHQDQPKISAMAGFTSKPKPLPKQVGFQKAAVSKAGHSKNEPITLGGSDSEEDISSLSERLKMRMLVSPAPAKAHKDIGRGGGNNKKRPKEPTPIKAHGLGGSSSTQILHAAASPALSTPVRKPSGKKRRLKSAQKQKQQQKGRAKTKAGGAKKATSKKKVLDSESDFEDDNSGEEQGQKEEQDEQVPIAASKPRRTRAAPKKSIYVELDSDEESGASEDEDDDDAKASKPRAKASKAKSAQKDDSDDEDFELKSESDEDFDDEDSDFSDE